MNAKTRRHSRCRYGATTVEMAVVAPIFILLVFGLIEFGRVVMLQQAVTESARAGCRKAILATTISSGDAESAARDHLHTATANKGRSFVEVSPADFSDMKQGTDITTIVEVSFSDVSWIVPDFLGGLVLHGESTMSRE